MNRKGFTLTELLAVFVILAIIFAIAMINYSEAVKNRKNNDYNNIVSIIEENTKVLVNTDFDVSNKVDNILEDNNECKIGYNVLIEKGLMDSDTKNPINNKVIDSNSYIRVSLNSNNDLEYEFIYIDIDEGSSEDSLVNCLSSTN